MADVVNIAIERRKKCQSEIATLDEFLRLADVLMRSAGNVAEPPTDAAVDAPPPTDEQADAEPEESDDKNGAPLRLFRRGHTVN